MKDLKSGLLAWLGIILIAIGIAVLIGWLNMRFTESSDCGSFDISAYKLGNVPARCAGYLVN